MRTPTLVAAVALTVVASACGSGAARGQALADVASATITVNTDYPPPNNVRTTSFTSPADVASLQAALNNDHIGIVSSPHGKMGDCTGGVNVSMTVELGGSRSSLSGQSYACGNQESGTITGNVLGLVDDLRLAPGS